MSMTKKTVPLNDLEIAKKATMKSLLLFCGEDRARTDDLLAASQAL